MVSSNVALSKDCCIGSWQTSLGVVSLFLTFEKKIYGVIKDHFGNVTRVCPHRVKGGINRNVQSVQIYEMCLSLSCIHRLSVVLHMNLSKEVEIIVFPALCAAGLIGLGYIQEGEEQIKKAEELQKEGRLEDAEEAYKDAICCFEQGLTDDDVVVQAKEKLLKAQLELTKMRLNFAATKYLAIQINHTLLRIRVKNSISIEELFNSMRKSVDNSKEHNELVLFQKSCIEEKAGNTLLAVEFYMQLATMHKSQDKDEYALNCLLKAVSLVGSLDKEKYKMKYENFLGTLDMKWLYKLAEKTGNKSLLQIISHKHKIRKSFDIFLAKIKEEGEVNSKHSSPQCFICYSLEKDVTMWLKKIFIPDLDLIGIHPIVSFRGLTYGGDLLPFEKLIRYTPLVAIICTPDMKEKCIERKDAPVGVVMELRFANQRFNDKDKKDSIIPIYVKGSYIDALPDITVEPTFSYQLNGGCPQQSNNYLSNVEYFSKALELLAVMRGLPRERGSQLSESFLEEIETIPKSSDEVSLEKVQTWLGFRTEHTKKVLESAQIRVSNMIQVYNVPSPPDILFGREQQLKELQSLCQQNTKVAVTGLGGIGKTALALYYAHHKRDYYRFVYFISSESPQLIKKGLLDLARRLYISGSQSEEILQNLKERLSDLEDKFLLIFDGIDHPDAFNFLSKYLPNGGTCFFLTSRGHERAVEMRCKTVLLKELSIRDSALLLLKVAEKNEKELEDAETLVRELGCLPLALVQAGSAIRRRNWSIQSYIDNFRSLGAKELLSENHGYIKKKFNLTNLSREDQELIEAKYINKGEAVVFKTWTITMKIIEEEHQSLIAKQILGYCSLMENASIPLFFIRDWCQLAFPQYCYDEGLIHLIDYSMISKDETEFYSVHPIVKLVSQTGLTSAEKESLVKQAIKTFASVSEKYDHNHKKTWKYAKPIVTHFPALLRNVSSEIQQEKQTFVCLHQIYKNLAPYLSEMGSHDLAIYWAERAFELSKELYGSDSAASAESYFHLGVALNFNAAHEKAEEKLIKAIEIYRSLCPEKQDLKKFSGRLQFAKTLIYLALIKIAQERYEKAEEFLREAEEMLAIDSLETEVYASLQHNFAELFASKGDHAQAVHHIQIAREIREKIYDKHDLQYIGTLEDLGQMMFMAGRRKEGLELQKSALELYEDFRGNDYATALNNIGFCCLESLNFDEAKKYLTRSLELRKQIYGPTHTWVGTPLRYLAKVYSRTGQFNEAERLFLEFVSIKRRSSSDKQELASSLCELGENQLELNKLKEAKSNIEQGLKMFEELMKNSEKKRSIVSLIARGKLNAVEGKFELAEEDLRSAVMLVQERFSVDHPDLIMPMQALGRFLINYGNEAEGKEYLEKTSEIQSQIKLEFEQSLS